MNNLNFVIDVADNRNKYLMQLLHSDGYQAEEYSLNRDYDDKEDEYVFVFAPSTKVEMTIAEKINCKGHLFCLDTDADTEKHLKNKGIEVHLFFDDEELAMKNAHLTAEGALHHIIMNTDVSVKGSNILVLGYGRLGKTITRLLKNAEANVYVSVNSKEEQAQASVVADYVCDVANCKKHYTFFSCIVNTIPAMIIAHEELMRINNDCFVLDLASKPGGVDHILAKELNIKTLHALGVPGKTAPKSAAIYIRESIYKVLYNT